jgi:lysozyme
MTDKQIPIEAIYLAKEFEGFSAKPYKCPAGYWTVGYGHLCDENFPEISESDAHKILIKDLRIAMDGVLRCCPNLVNFGEKKLAAIIDFTLNLGVGRLAQSTLRKKINAADWNGAAEELNKWVLAGKKKLRGLVIRRKAESELLLDQLDSKDILGYLYRNRNFGK